MRSSLLDYSFHFPHPPSLSRPPSTNDRSIKDLINHYVSHYKQTPSFPMSPGSVHSSGRDLSGATHISVESHMTQPSGFRAPVNMNINSRGQGGRCAHENTADRFELFLLGDGEKKVTEETDTRKPTLALPNRLPHDTSYCFLG